MDQAQTLRQAREAIQRGDRATGQRLLTQILEKNPRSEVAWLWMSALMDDPDLERECLEKVLEINPNNGVAQKHLIKFQPAAPSAPPPPPTEPMDAAPTNEDEPAASSFRPLFQADETGQLGHGEYQDEPEQRESLENLGCAIGSLGLGVAGGIVGMALGAGLWAAITVIIDYQIGYMAIGLGLLVGLGVRFTSGGAGIIHGLIGGSLALVGCLLGNLLSVLIVISRELDVPFFTLLFNLDWEIVVEFLKVTFSPIDVLFYLLAIYAGFRFASRRTIR
jgi:hypothetical protein